MDDIQGIFDRILKRDHSKVSLSFLSPPQSLRAYLIVDGDRLALSTRGPAAPFEPFIRQLLQMSLVFTRCDLFCCAGALQATLPERRPKERRACTRCVPVDPVATEAAWPTPPPATRATAARVTAGATAR